ncbi:hypothetical protein F5Y03DRAFT_399844 [Xylaria venustula]|nr:hypothetical protein F5Y03DRAFT_399844 [Xylaria venustula]
MRGSIFFHTAMAVAVGMSPAIAMVVRQDISSAKPIKLRELGCNKDAIDTCTTTGQDSSACFGYLCAGRALETIAKRQDSCTEDNLLQCAILDWNEAQACFQEFCL